VIQMAKGGIMSPPSLIEVAHNPDCSKFDIIICKFAEKYSQY